MATASPRNTTETDGRSLIRVIAVVGVLALLYLGAIGVNAFNHRKTAHQLLAPYVMLPPFPLTNVVATPSYEMAGETFASVDIHMPKGFARKGLRDSLRSRNTLQAWFNVTPLAKSGKESQTDFGLWNAHQGDRTFQLAFDASREAHLTIKRTILPIAPRAAVRIAAPMAAGAGRRP